MVAGLTAAVAASRPFSVASSVSFAVKRATVAGLMASAVARLVVGVSGASASLVGGENTREPTRTPLC